MIDQLKYNKSFIKNYWHIRLSTQPYEKVRNISNQDSFPRFSLLLYSDFFNDQIAILEDRIKMSPGHNTYTALFQSFNRHLRKHKQCQNTHNPKNERPRTKEKSLRAATDREFPQTMKLVELGWTAARSTHFPFHEIQQPRVSNRS